MKILKFKTNIENEEMLDRIVPILDQTASISKWKLDLKSTDKILSVSGEEISPDVITKIFRENGFEAEPLTIVAIGGHDL